LRAGRFAFVSPVWLQLRPKDKSASHHNAPTLTGLHDVDAGWMDRVRAAAPACASGTGGHGEAGVEAVEGDVRVSLERQRAGRGRCPRIVPRIAWEMPATATLDEKWVVAAVHVIVRVVEQHGLDGVVLDGPTSPGLFALLRPLAAALHRLPPTSPAAGPRVLIGVLPPVVAEEGGRQAGLNHAHLESLHGVVDRWSVMTYDYSAHRGGGGTGPNAPVKWAVDVLTALAPNPDVRRTLLLGVPWYGYDENDAITGDRWRALVSAGGLAASAGAQALLVNKRAAEHYLRYTPTPTTSEGGSPAQSGRRPHTVYYPTPWMLAKRSAAAASLGSGLAVWELGQGLPCFPDSLP
jgi:chitinase domain-containing protein 1